MKIFKRYLTGQAEKDLKHKMVFIGGPRQVGKTTLAKHIAGFDPKGYLNWDIAEHREKMLKKEWPITSLWVFDEIHKYHSWRNVLKGLYDQFSKQHRILVTGSAHLNVYRHGGDSLQGRYHYLQLHPLSAAELHIHTQKELLDLLELGGFPEPFFRGSKTESKRWSREYRTRLIQDDIKTLERIQDIGNLELLMLRLPQLVGSPLSINAVREDLQVSHKAISNWLIILEKLYAIFRLSPFGVPKIRAVKKEQKHYHFDWTLIDDISIRFENMVACHLLKWVHYQQDVFGENMELRYFRDVDGREIDFIVILNEKPVLAVECKWTDAPVSNALKYFKARFPECEMWQITGQGNKDYLSGEGIRVAPAPVLLKTLI
jgi:hypothetical protein